jgi:trans-2,3-dihydro-3-hydroxyanthranilate isomerase
MSAHLPAMLQYDIVDVFTDRAFAGNPLAVVHGAEALADEQLLAIAKEFNLSETTFPSVAAERGDGARKDYTVRIFTPAGEVPFAGHPTLGTAWVLRQHGRIAAGPVVQRCGVGDIAVEVPEDATGALRLSAEPRDLAGPLDAEAFARAVGLSAEQVRGDVLAAGCGLTWVHLPVAADALAGCRGEAGLESALEKMPTDRPLLDPVAGVNVYAVEEGSGDVGVRSRVLCPDVGVIEDPATGSAAVGLGIALVARGVLPRGGAYTIRQGVEMGRPSTLHGRVDVADGRAARCQVAGGVVSVASGTIAVPEV